MHARRTINWSILIGFFFAAASAQAMEVYNDQDVQQHFLFLSSLTSGSVLEGAGSHGGFGTSLGAGIQSKPDFTNQNLSATDLDQKTGNALVSPKIFLIKGLPWPVDFGGSIGILGDGHATTWMGFAQWTFFEGFHRPSFTIKGYHAKIAGLRFSEFASSGLSLAAGMSFLKYFTVYGDYTLTHHTGKLWVPNEAVAGFRLADATEFVEKNWDQAATSLGLRVVVVPPFVSVAVEEQQSQFGQVYFAKVGVGI